MNEKIEVPTMQVPPLKKVCMTIGQLPASYIETMSYYEMLVWFVNYLRDDIIPVVNANGEATKELQELYVELQKYVNNYFDNLDVQEEVNNKLDEMAESGQLTEIIAEYLGLAGMITFNNVSEMKLANNLVNGSKCQTLGYYSVNDNGKALYKVRTITNEDVVDEMTLIALYDENLVAELVYDNDLIPEQFGAKSNDNTFDNSTIFNKMILVSNETEKVIRIGKDFYISNSIVIPQGAKIRIIGNNGFDSAPIRSIIYTGSDSVFVTQDGTEHVHISLLKNINFIAPTDSTASVFKNIIFDTSLIDNCSFINFDMILNGGGLRFVSTMSNCKSLNIKTCAFKITSAANFSDSVIKNNYFNGNKTTYPSLITGPIDNDNIFDSNYIDFFKYIFKYNGTETYGSQWINNKFEPIFRFANCRLLNCKLIGNYFTCNKTYATGWATTFTDTFMQNGMWGAFVSHPNDTVYEESYTFDFRDLTLIGNHMGRESILLYIIGEPSSTSSFARLYETGTGASSSYGLYSQAVFFHPFSSTTSHLLLNSRCDSNYNILTAPVTTGQNYNLKYIHYNNTNNVDTTVRGNIMYNKDLPLKFVDTDTNKLYIYNSYNKNLYGTSIDL